MLLSGIILGTIGIIIWVYDFMTRLSSENSRATGGITSMRRAKRKPVSQLANPNGLFGRAPICWLIADGLWGCVEGVPWDLSRSSSGPWMGGGGSVPGSPIWLLEGRLDPSGLSLEAAGRVTPDGAPGQRTSGYDAWGVWREFAVGPDLLSDARDTENDGNPIPDGDPTGGGAPGWEGGGGEDKSECVPKKKRRRKKYKRQRKTRLASAKS